MEAEKSHDLQSPSWRPRKANGVVTKPESWRVSGVDFSPSVKA